MGTGDQADGPGDDGLGVSGELGWQLHAAQMGLQQQVHLNSPL